jgi:hypothetical protein
MSIITELLNNISLPKMVRVRQKFSVCEVDDIAGTVRAELRRANIASRIKSGARIAVGVGSRGVAEIPLIVKITIEELTRCGAKPFIVPAMGSHGGATAEGQIQVLANLGVTEASAGCSILSSMEVVELGKLENGLPVLVDKNAYEADGIVIINRVKAHTAFSGPNESGLVKMISIGLGKQKGADSCHALGFKYMADFVVKMAEIKLRQLPFLFGIATVENAYDHVAKIVAIPAEEIIAAEQKLLVEAKANMPKLLLQPMDVLVVDQMGKEFSGSGMDPYTTGRAATPYLNPGPGPSRLVVLDVTERSHGNATGMGNADITTRRLFNKIDFDFTYANVLTATVTASGRIPVLMDSDRLAIQAAIKTCNSTCPDRIRMVRIADSLHLREILVSESMLADAEQHPDITVVGRPTDWLMDAEGNLTDIGKWL